MRALRSTPCWVHFNSSRVLPTFSEAPMPDAVPKPDPPAPRCGMAAWDGPVARTSAAGFSAVSPRDRALAGLIARGHGREACCAFLGLDEAALLERVVALGLPTPSLDGRSFRP